MYAVVPAVSSIQAIESKAEFVRGGLARGSVIKSNSLEDLGCQDLQRVLHYALWHF